MLGILAFSEIIMQATPRTMVKIIVLSKSCDIMRLYYILCELRAMESANLIIICEIITLFFSLIIMHHLYNFADIQN